MCGIAGFWTSVAGKGVDASRTILHAMTGAIAHRGPDGDGFWIDAEGGAALGHRRLSIIDLSAAGAQPMQSASGRYILVYNGEIYNHLDLRRYLEARGAAPQWRGHSDTETLLAMVEAFGLEETLKQTIGMFALAMWDRRERTLDLARDRMGEKPLYYGWSGQTLLFGSELKALRAYPGFANRIDSNAVSAYLGFAYVPAPQCIYSGLFKLPPGTWLRLASATPQLCPKPQTYWSMQGALAAGAAARTVARDENEAADELERLLTSVVASQMLSDVPLGSFLSGGVDSSLITALMRKTASSAVRTFSIGFDDGRYNEAPYAKAVAEHLGTEHTELIVKEREALQLAPELSGIYDEPFADSSQIPTILLSRMTRAHVTVALSGDGGDEIFGGYNRYLFAPRLWSRIGRIPRPLRRGAGALFNLLEPALRCAVSPTNGNILARLGLPGSVLDRLGPLSQVASRAGAIADVYFGLANVFPDAGAIARTPAPIDNAAAWRAFDGLDLSNPERMMLIDALTYLPDDIMVKVDRAAMSASLESRAPYLDPRVVEFACALPLANKISGSTGKTILRRALDRHVPKSLIDRPKQGFGVPIDAWLRGGLKDWASDLLAPRDIAVQGLLQPAAVTRLWQAHQSGRNCGAQLWTILMLQSWLRAGQASPAAAI